MRTRTKYLLQSAFLICLHLDLPRLVQRLLRDEAGHLLDLRHHFYICQSCHLCCFCRNQSRPSCVKAELIIFSILSPENRLRSEALHARRARGLVKLIRWRSIRKEKTWRNGRFRFGLVMQSRLRSAPTDWRTFFSRIVVSSATSDTMFSSCAAHAFFDGSVLIESSAALSLRGKIEYCFRSIC